jgi:hypothetical protein
MTAPQPLPSRLIGALFVERGLVSESQIRIALEIQNETGQQLGQILVERFGVERAELAKVVAEHWARMGEAKEDVSTRASESWRQLGEILVSRGFVTREQLVQALDRQRLTGERLGEALVGQGVISKFELAGSLAEQASLADAPAEPEGEPAPVVHLTPRLDDPLEQAPAEDEEPPEPTFLPEPVVVPGSTLEAILTVAPEPEPTPEPTATDHEEAPPAHEDVPQPEPAPAACVAFASTPRGYRFVELENGAVPEVGRLLEVPDVGVLVVLRHGPSPLPADERVCVFLEPVVPAGVSV